MYELIIEVKNIKALNQIFFNNTVLDYILALATFLVLFLIIKIAEKFLLGRLKKSLDREKEGFRSVLIKFILSIKASLYLFAAFFTSLLTLTVDDRLIGLLQAILVVWITIRFMLGVQMVVDYVLDRKLLDGADPGTKVAAKNIGTIFKVLLWIFAILLLLSNFGVEVTSLIAGLGVGGIAIAFALQSVLEDLFSSFAIYFDKPFTVGDFIVVDDQKTGVVEKIGIKTTRIRALQGEEIVISNRDLTTERIHNFKKLEKRRSLFEFGVVYSTSDEKMEEIPRIVEEIITEQEMTEFDRAHFKGFGDSALEFEVSYYVLSSEYIDYRNVHEKVLLEIKRRFNKQNIEMAFPTRTVHLFNK